MPPSPSRLILIKVCKSDVISPFERANLDRATHEVARNLPTIEPNPDEALFLFAGNLLPA